MAQAVFHEFRAYQRSAPILNLAAFLPLAALDAPAAPAGDADARPPSIRGLIAGLTADRARGDCGGDGAG